MVNAPVATHTVELPKFGTVTYAENDVLAFPWGLPGFEQLRSFLILALDSQEHVLWLQSLEETNVALPLADPWVFFPDYDPKLPAFAKLSLDLNASEDFATLAILVVPESGPSFMNLMAPVVINLKTRIGRQIALETGNYSVATQLPFAEPAPTPVQAEAAAE
jgi:flagellar assembly factor FliW